MPKTLKLNQADVLRSYWSQRLLWLINGTVVFQPPTSFRARIKAELDYDLAGLRVSDLVQFLYKWKFYDCMLDLALSMAYEGHWDIKEVENVKNWIADLNSIGYNEPQILNFEEKSPLYAPNGHDYVRVRYTPSFKPNPELSEYCCNGDLMNVYDKYKSFKYFAEFCQLSKFNLSYNFGLNRKKNNLL